MGMCILNKCRNRFGYWFFLFCLEIFFWFFEYKTEPNPDHFCCWLPSFVTLCWCCFSGSFWGRGQCACALLWWLGQDRSGVLGGQPPSGTSLPDSEGLHGECGCLATVPCTLCLGRMDFWQLLATLLPSSSMNFSVRRSARLIKGGKVK